MKISVITVAHNGESSNEDTIHSLQRQGHNNVEHIVIDGGSTHGTPAILELHRDKIAVLVSEPDDGIYHAMNKALALATGDIIGFLNATMSTRISGC